MDEKLITLARCPLELPNNIDELLYKLIEEKKVFTDSIETLISIANSLISGKHIVLYGPVGTGKTTLAREIAGIFNADLEIVNVGENWESPDELIGHKTLAKGEVKFNKGPLTKALEKCYQYIEYELFSPFNIENPKQACWLILDEMNRGNINRYLSSIITALEPLRPNLNRQDLEEIYKIYIDIGQESIKVPIPSRFRIIGTINTFDMNFLYSFPSALEGRRFDFIPVNPPTNINYEIEIIQNILLSEFHEIEDSILRGLLDEIEKLIINLRSYGFHVGTTIFADICRKSVYKYILFTNNKNNLKLKDILDSVSSTIFPPIIRKLTPNIKNDIIKYLKDNSFKKTIEVLDMLLLDIIEEF